MKRTTAAIAAATLTASVLATAAGPVAAAQGSGSAAGAAADKIVLWDESTEVVPEGRTPFVYQSNWDWSVTAVRPITGNPTLYMYEKDQRMATSRHPGTTTEFIAARCRLCTWGPNAMFPVVKSIGGTSFLYLADRSVWTFYPGDEQTLTLGEAELVKTWFVPGLEEGKEYTFTLTGADAGDADIYLMVSDAERVAYLTAEDAAAYSNAAPAGGVESFSFVAGPLSDTSHGFIVIQESGSGSYNITLTETG